MSSAAAVATDPKGTTTIQLDTMPLDQLNTLKQREESRLQALSQRYAALRQAAARINAAKHAVQELYNISEPSISNSNNKADDDTTTTNISESDNDTTVTSKDKGEQPIIMTTTKDVFVPLTESVYVPGKIRIRAASAEPLPVSPQQKQQPNIDESSLLIELGTGYFVEQNATTTNDYLQRKLNLVDANSDNVTQAIQATRQNMESIAIAMRGKLIEIQAKQQGQRTQQMAAIAEESE